MVIKGVEKTHLHGPWAESVLNALRGLNGPHGQLLNCPVLCQPCCPCSWRQRTAGKTAQPLLGHREGGKAHGRLLAWRVLVPAVGRLCICVVDYLKNLQDAARACEPRSERDWLELMSDPAPDEQCKSPPPTKSSCSKETCLLDPLTPGQAPSGQQEFPSTLLRYHQTKAGIVTHLKRLP